jgi:tetratricopeptide (TPR) repeat protein
MMYPEKTLSIRNLSRISLMVLLVTMTGTGLFAQDNAGLRVAVTVPVPSDGETRSEMIALSLEQNLARSAGSVPGVILVERNNLDALFKELELQLTGIVTGTAEVPVAALMRADYLIVSSYRSEGQNLVVAVKAIRVADGTIVAALGDSGRASEQAAMLEKLGTELARALGLEARSVMARVESELADILEKARRAATAGDMRDTATLARRYLQQTQPLSQTPSQTRSQAQVRAKAEALTLLYQALSSGQPEASPDETISVLDMLVQADPGNAEWRYARARYREEAGDKTRAADDWTAVFDLAPADRDLTDASTVFFAFSMPDPGRTALALERASKGRWGTATIARIRGLHGVALVSSGEHADGVRALEDARKGGEKATWLHESLGLAYLELGKPRDAARSLEEAAKIREKAGTGFDRFWIEVLVEALEAANRKADAAEWRRKAGL